MGIGEFFKRFTKGGKPEAEAEAPGQSPTSASNSNPRRRPVPKLPGWAKKDNAFVRPTMGMMPPPDDMAEEATFKRPGSWLKQKLGGGDAVDEVQALEKLQKIKETREKLKAASDTELEAFFHGLLDEVPVEPELPEAEKKE